MPLNIIRRIVSGQKKRFQDGPDGFDLDLAYISPRVIAMGLPAVQGKEVLYRNPMQEIARFLQTYHRNQAKVFNLCSEHQYSAQHLSVALQQYPYDDHQTPPLAMVQQFCVDAAAWLAADPANVVVVHCKAGKGRTGIMICCLLLYLHKNAPELANLPISSAAAAAAAGAHAAGARPDYGQQQAATASNTQADFNNSSRPGSVQQRMLGAQQQSSSRLWHPWQRVPPVELHHLDQPVQDILDMYAERRTHDGNGVTIKSQRRYVGYFWAVLCTGSNPVGQLPKPRSVQLRQVTVSGLPHGTADSCVLLVEARPSGSLAPRADRVCARSAPRALSGSLTGMCMVSCTHAPMVQDNSCSISTGPLGDTLTFKMPAASMGLSPLPLSRSNSAARAAAGNGLCLADAEGGAATAAVPDSFTAGLHGCCVCCGAASASSCTCASGCEGLPGAVPVTPDAGLTASHTAAGAAAQPGCAEAAHNGSGTAVADEHWEASEQTGCCVVEGDVRLVVLKGTTRLFYTWFNTAFLPASGSYTLTRAQLDKPSKTLPHELSLTVRFVDMQPTAEAEGEQLQLQEQQQKEQHSFQDPPLETTGKAMKGSAQQQQCKGVKQQQVQGNSMLAAAAAQLSAFSMHSVFEAYAAGDHRQAVAAVHNDGQQQQQVTQLPVPISSSAPASPQGSKLRSSGSWRRHLPAISSISTSAVLWGSAAGESASAQQRRSAKDAKLDSPGSWAGPASLNWDWDTLVAAEDGSGWMLGCGDAAGPGSGVSEASAGSRGAGSYESRAVSAGVGYAYQQQWRSALLPGRPRSTPLGGSSIATRFSQDLHSSAASASSRVVPGLLPSQASIELPVIVKRPSGINSLVDALLDPEHSASSQTSNAAAAAAAAAATGRVLASEASSSAVAGRGSAAGYSAPSQLRKGYSWHGGSGSWFAAAAGSSVAGSANSSSGSQKKVHTKQRGYQQGNSSAPAAVSASALDLDPLLLSERSGEVPGSVLSSCDPLQGLLEALNWSTDVQRYHAPVQSRRSSWASGSRRSTSSEPSSPRCSAGHLPTVLSSPQLQPTRSAPATPTELGGRQTPMQLHPDSLAIEQLGMGRTGADSGDAGSAWLPSNSSSDKHRVGSSGMRRSKAVRADVCRLLDLEEWAEDETEGVDAAAGEPVSKHAATQVAHVRDEAGKAGGSVGSSAAQAKGWALGLHRRCSDDAAAAADIPAPPPTPANHYYSSAVKIAATATGAGSRRPPAPALGVSWRAGGSSRASGSSQAVTDSSFTGARDESLIGLLAAEGPLAPSCAAEAPAVQQQWQQLEKAWQKSWWV